jgi:hypothetical protein
VLPIVRVSALGEDEHVPSGSGVTAAGWFVACSCGWRTSDEPTSTAAWSAMAEHARSRPDRRVGRRWSD